MRRWRLLLGLCIGLTLFAGASLGIVRTKTFHKWYTPPILLLPTDEEVPEVRASLLASQVGFEEIPEFVVPEEHVPIILGWLRPATYIREPHRLDKEEELGKVVIRSRSGQQLHLRFYWAGAL